jgi:hypothetical protein
MLHALALATAGALVGTPAAVRQAVAPRAPDVAMRQYYSVRPRFVFTLRPRMLLALPCLVWPG